VQQGTSLSCGSVIIFFTGYRASRVIGKDSSEEGKKTPNILLAVNGTEYTAASISD
jgi:hypothetical protein